MTLSPSEHNTLRMPELPKPPTLKDVVADFVTGRLRKRIASLERRYTVLVDKVNDHAAGATKDYSALYDYITKVARAGKRDRAEFERMHAEMLSTLATLTSAVAANNNGVPRRVLPPPHPSLRETVRDDDDEKTNVMGAR